MTLSNLSEFAYQDTFRLPPGFTLVFTGTFINSNDKNRLGKNLYIPQTKKHPAMTFKITGRAWPGITGTSSLAIQFDTAEEREAIALLDFTNDIFYVEL